MIQRFEVIAVGINVCGIRDITREHCSFIVCSFWHTGLEHTMTGL